MTLPQAGNEAALSRDPVEELAEAFLERYRRGERPALSEFIARAPEHADEIRELFPALVLLEQADLAASGPKPAAVCQVERLGDYRLLREVGRGGMGIVYEAEQESLGRRVALKILPASITDARSLVRFRREARSAARLHHTNIVPVFDIGEREGIHYYAMQFIQGQGLDEVIVELQRLRRLAVPSLIPAAAPDASDAAGLAEKLLSGTFRGDELTDNRAESSPPGNAPADSSGVARAGDNSSTWTSRSDISSKSDMQFYRSVARIGLQAAEALAYAHGQRVLHRDIKPSNLLLDASGSVWVTDFGLAKEEGEDFTRTGDVVGTLRYLAPERLNGVSEPSSDIYGLGVTLYELLTLQPAFPQTDQVGLVQRITRQDPVAPRKLDPHVPRDLETVVLKAIAKEPARRYASAGDMAEDLRRFLMDRPIRARRASPLERTWRWCRRNPGWAVTLGAAVGLLLFIAIGGSIVNLHLQQALRDVRSANDDKTEKLWQSYLERARALRSSGRVGQRFEALKVIREAAKIKVTADLRDEAVAALVLPDVEIASEWESAAAQDALIMAFDAKFERYARINRKGEVTVCRRTADGEEIVARLPVHGEPRFWGLWMSPDGRFLAYGHSAPREGVAGSVRIMRLDGPQPVLYKEEPAGMHLFALSFHANCRHLAIGHTDGTISIYDLDSNAPPLRRPIGRVPNTLAFHPRDLRLAAACGDSVRVIDVNTGKEGPVLRDPKIHRWSFGLAWHPNGRVLAATSEDRNIHLWDTQSATELVRPIEGHPAEGIVMAFNNTGDRLISNAWDGQCRLWDTTTGRLMLTMPGLYGVQFGRDNAQPPDAPDALLGVSRSGKKLRLLRLADGRELAQLRRPLAKNGGELASPALDADNRILAASSGSVLTFFDLHRGTELASLQFDDDKAASPRKCQPHSGWLTSGTTGALRWPVKYDPIRPNVLRIGPPQILATSRDGADATADGRITAIPQGVQTLVLDRDHPGKRIILRRQTDVRHVALSPDGKLVATFGWWWDGRSKSVGIWEAETGRHITDLGVEGESYGRFSPDGRWLMIINQGCQLWEVDGWRPVRVYECSSHCWSPDKRWLAVSDTVGVVRLVEPQTDREVLKLTGPGATWYHPACFTSDSAKLIAVAGDTSALYVWDLRLIRKQLRELGMDWELPEFPPPATDNPPPITVELDPGMLRPRWFDNDRQAVAAMSIALAIQPINPEAHLQRGLAFERLKDSARAVKDFEMFLALAAADDPRRAEIGFARAKNYRNLRNSRDVLDSLAQLADTSTESLPWPADYARRCNEIAWFYVKPRNARAPDAVLRVTQKAVTLEPFNFFFVNTHGVALYRAGRYQEAIRWLEKNLEMSQEHIAFDLYFLAMSHARLGQLAEARAYFDRANASVQAETALAKNFLDELAGFRAEAEEVLGIAKMK